MTPEQIQNVKEECLSMLMFFHNSGERIPEDLATDLEFYGIAKVFPVDDGKQHIDIHPEWEPAWKQLEEEAFFAELEDEFGGSDTQQ